MLLMWLSTSCDSYLRASTISTCTSCLEYHPVPWSRVTPRLTSLLMVSAILGNDEELHRLPGTVDDVVARDAGYERKSDTIDDDFGTVV